MTGHDRTRPLWADLPHAAAISALLEELRTLSPDEAEALSASWWAAAWGDGLGDLTDAEAEALVVARGAARADAWAAARFATAGAVRASGARISAGDAAMGAALALVIADLVGQYGLTREHLYVLTAPARVVPRLASVIDRALPTIAKEN